jgi:hypothetical protein
LVENENRPQIVAALQQWGQGNQQPAIDALRPLADGGDEDAIVLVAWMLGQLGRAVDGIPYAEKAFESGAALATVNYGPNLLAQGNRPEGVEWLRRALAWGWPHDPLGYVPQAIQQGDPDTAYALLQLARTSRAEMASTEVEKVLDSARSSLTEMTELRSASTQARDAAVEGINQDARHIANERTRVEGLVEDVTKLVHGVAAEHLAQQYASRADETETTAQKYTTAAIVGGIVAALASIGIAVAGLAGGHDVSSILSKGLLTLPVIALAGYFGGLARSHRQMAWHYRHVELQIRTAEPYLAPLDDRARKTMLAALALRFFPGQTLNPQRGDTEMATDTPAIVAALTDKLPPLGDTTGQP